MSLAEIFLLAAALAVDAFSVATAVGCRHCAPMQILRLSLNFGFFQSLFTAGGALLGRFMAAYIESIAPWVAFVLLSIIGLHMMLSALKKKPEQPTQQAGNLPDPTRGWTLIGLSTAVSLDAFGAGAGLALSISPGRLIFSCLVIGLVALGGTGLGMRLGSRVGKKLGARAGILAGLVLILLGVRMLLS